MFVYSAGKLRHLKPKKIADAWTSFCLTFPAINSWLINIQAYTGSKHSLHLTIRLLIVNPGHFTVSEPRLPKMESIPSESFLDEGQMSTANNKSSLAKGEAAKNMQPLPDDFQPGENDVICGRGRNVFNHIGNDSFRTIVAGYLDHYNQASAKLEKSFILSEIVTKVRELSPNGGFVKKDPKSGRWFEVGDFLAREKTSQAFRDALHDKYRSSNTAKKLRRQVEQIDRLHSSQSDEERDFISQNSASLQLGDLESVQSSLLGTDLQRANAFLGENLQLMQARRSARSVLDFHANNKATGPLKQNNFNWLCPNLGSKRNTTPLNTEASMQNFDWGTAGQTNTKPSASLFADLGDFPPLPIANGMLANQIGGLPGRNHNSASFANLPLGNTSLLANFLSQSIAPIHENAPVEGPSIQALMGRASNFDPFDSMLSPEDSQKESLKSLDDIMITPIGAGKDSDLFAKLALLTDEYKGDGNVFEPTPIGETA
jgi:hypothetical protein